MKGLAVAVLATVLCSCGESDDESNNGGSGGGAASIVGNWTLVNGTEDGVTVTAQ